MTFCRKFGVSQYVIELLYRYSCHFLFCKLGDITGSLPADVATVSSLRCSPVAAAPHPITDAKATTAWYKMCCKMPHKKISFMSQICSLFTDA